jgi:hypothetical protein
LHVDDFPQVAIQVLEAVLVHEPVACDFLGVVPPAATAVPTMSSTFLRLSTERQTDHFRLLGRVAESLRRE